MGFKDDMENYQKETAGDGGFYKFTLGDHRMRVFSEPVRKDSRFGYGICYPGAVYCDPVALKKENDEKIAKYNEDVKAALAAGATKESVKKPSLSNVGTKWSVWALIRKTGDFSIVDITSSVAQKIYDFMSSDEYKFESFPMPYDITIQVTQKKVKNPTKKDIEYDVLPARANTPITDEETLAFEKLTPVAQIIGKMQAKQKDKMENGGDQSSAPIDYPEEDINAEDIPF